MIYAGLYFHQDLLKLADINRLEPQWINAADRDGDLRLVRHFAAESYLIWKARVRPLRHIVEQYLGFDGVLSTFTQFVISLEVTCRHRVFRDTDEGLERLVQSFPIAKEWVIVHLIWGPRWSHAGVESGCFSLPRIGRRRAVVRRTIRHISAWVNVNNQFQLLICVVLRSVARVLLRTLHLSCYKS